MMNREGPSTLTPAERSWYSRIWVGPDSETDLDGTGAVGTMSFTRLRLDELANAWAEDSNTPFQISLVGVFEPGPLRRSDGVLETQRVREELAARVRRVAALRRRVVWTRFGEGLPVWAEDPSFDPAQHITVTAVPESADFVDWCANRLVRPLDKQRPLWRIEIVDGLPSGRFALIVVVHHVVADGLTGVAIASSLLDGSPSEHVADTGSHPIPPPPDRHTLVADNVRARARSLVAIVRGLPGAPSRVRQGWRRLGDASTDLRVRAPLTSLSVPVGPERRLAVVTVAMEQLRMTGHALGVTVNDLLLAGVTSGLRDLLLGRGDDLTGVQLRASVPVGAREEGQPSGILVINLPVSEPDGLRRLAIITQMTTQLKSRLRGGGGDVMDVLQLPPAAARLAVRWMRGAAGRRINLFITNVPGPTTPLWLAGSRLLEAWPVAPLVANVPLAVTALSYTDSLYVSLNADAAVHDLRALANGIQRSVQTLSEAAQAGHHLPILDEATVSSIRMVRGVVENRIDIAAAPEHVFAFITNGEHELEWNEQLTEAEKLTTGPIGVGTRFRMRFRRGVGDSLVEYVRFAPPHSWASRSTSRRLDVRFEGEVNATDSGSRLVVRTLLLPKGPLRLLRPVLRTMMRRSWDHHLAAIRTKLTHSTSQPEASAHSIGASQDT
jgi:diacylglycerol O-acyltransferase / wax synthase